VLAAVAVECRLRRFDEIAPAPDLGCNFGQLVRRYEASHGIGVCLRRRMLLGGFEPGVSQSFSYRAVHSASMLGDVAIQIHARGLGALPRLLTKRVDFLVIVLEQSTNMLVQERDRAAVLSQSRLVGVQQFSLDVACELLRQFRTHCFTLVARWGQDKL
jgi:hypothetical protein